MTRTRREPSVIAKIAAAKSALASIVLAACGTAPAAAPRDCPANPLPTCPSVPPSYQMTIAPILAARCTTCHSPAGVIAPPLDTYASVVMYRHAGFAQTYGCFMPPEPEVQLAEGDRRAVLGWLRCEAPIN